MRYRAVSFFVLFALEIAPQIRAENTAPAAPKTPATPIVRRLKLEPDQITLQDGRDAQKVLVLGETDSKTWIDLSASASFKSDSPCIEIDSAGYFHAKSKGQASVTVSAGEKLAKLTVKVADAEVPEVHFVRDVEPILSKVGCNAGTCHGSAKGKNGFKLSLRGYDPEYDYQALVNDLSGRRFNRVVVEESLMLLKPSAEVPHEGRQVFKVGSREYNLLRDWIKEGCKAEEVKTARANKIEIVPSEINLALPGM